MPNWKNSHLPAPCLQDFLALLVLPLLLESLVRLEQLVLPGVPAVPRGQSIPVLLVCLLKVVFVLFQ